MSGFVSVDHYTIRMIDSEQDILRTLMKSGDRIAAAHCYRRSPRRH